MPFCFWEYVACQAVALVSYTLSPDLSDILGMVRKSLFGPQHEKTCLRRVVSNKDADQPAHPRSLISAYVFRFSKSSISRLATSEISSF